MSPYPGLPEGFQDVVFGPQYLQENRIANHIRNRAGLRHLGRRSPVIPAADAPLELKVTSSGARPIDEVICWYQVEGQPEAKAVFRPAATQWDEVGWTYVRSWTAELPALPAGTIVSYRIGGRFAGGGDWVYADNQAGEAGAAQVFAYTVGPQPPPDWAAGSRIYHVFVDRFNPGPGRNWTGADDLREVHGGTLGGVTDKLGYIHGMGFNAIWLSPIFPSPSHHGYDATDLFSIEPRFGSMSDFEALVRAAHSLGVRVILDFVPNHWSDQHPTFLHARKNADSEFRRWYHWEKWPDDYLSFFNVRTMPKLNLSAGSPARKHLLDAARFWLEKGVDGYRVDHAEGPVSDFWPVFRRTCLEARPDVWLFGEVGRPPPMTRSYAGGLHGALDFSLEHALRQTFGLGQWDVAAFETFIREHLSFYPVEFSLPAFLDNHDTNRFLFIAGGSTDRLKLAALILYTHPGAPIVYYGTERGLSQRRTTDEGIGLDESRLPVDWADDSSAPLQAYFHRLNEIRRDHFKSGFLDRRLEYLDAGRGLYAYSWASGGGRVMIALNTGVEVGSLRFRDYSPVDEADLLSGLPLKSYKDGFEIELPPLAGVVIPGG